ncbi:MAG: hypothetical protein H7840_03750 [Alphaproteobacteria bacterium]
MPPPRTEPQPQSLPSQESLLLDYVHRLERHRKGRRAAHIHLSRLAAHHRIPQRLRVAVSTFESLVKMLQGQLFSLANGDLIFIFKDPNVNEVNSAIVKLQFMFADDALFIDAPDGEFGKFATFYDIETDYADVLKIAQQIVAEENQRRRADVRAEPAAAEQSTKPLEPISPGVLFRIEDALAQADLSNLIRRQSVSAVVGQSPPQVVFTELFVSIADLRATLLPNINLTSNRWLFQHLTDTLDRRVLALLTKNDDRTLESDFSLNLNVPTLISPEFLKFDDNIRTGARETIVIELQETDIFSDLSAYLFARDFVHECGYRVCIDGVSMRSLPFVSRSRLGADLIKIHWTPEMADLGDGDLGFEFRQLLKRSGLNRVILARCDGAEAIEFGQAQGITLFQGRHVEDLIAGEQRRRSAGGGRPSGRRK